MSQTTKEEEKQRLEEEMKQAYSECRLYKQRYIAAAKANEDITAMKFIMNELCMKFIAASSALDRFIGDSCEDYTGSRCLGCGC